MFRDTTGDSQNSVERRYEDKDIRLTGKMMATLYDEDVRTINHHIKKIFEDSGLTEDNIMHDILQMILAVGFKVNNERAVQFRKWANTIVKDYTIKGWAMWTRSAENGRTVLKAKYFEEQLKMILEGLRQT